MSRQVPSGEDFEPVGPVLEKALRQRGLTDLVLLVQVVKHWPVIAGAHLATVSHPIRLQFQELLISVNDAMWHQHILFYRAQFLQNIYRVLGQVPIKTLRFTLPTSPRSRRLPEPPAPSEAPERLPLTAAEERQIQESTAGISDPDLREAIRRAWRCGWQVRR